MILRYVMNLLLEIGAFAAWFVIVDHRQDAARPVRPDGARQLLHGPLDAYLFLLTETYPPFQDEQTRAAGVAPASI